MKLSDQQCKTNDHIPTETILKDIEDTKKEVIIYQNLVDVWMKNPQENKLDIYMTEGKIKRGEDFIESLECILEYRKRKEKEE